MGVYIKNWSLADWKELLMWAKIGANNAMIGEFAEVEEIPPHGRLIDAGELRELYEEWENDKEAGIDIDKCHVPIPVIRQNIDDAPAVLEAEEGET